jgi:hypothetical protein
MKNSVMHLSKCPGSNPGTLIHPHAFNLINFNMKTFTSRLLTTTLLFAGMVLFGASVFAQTTAGPFYPTVGTNVSSGTNTDWTNPGNVVSNNTVYTTVTDLAPLGYSDYLNATGFTFSIPSDASITGIQLSIERYTSGITAPFIRDYEVKLLKNGSLVGDNKALTASDWPTTVGVQSYGSASDLWGETWSPADINASNFGAALMVFNANSNSGRTRTAYVDYMTITVYYLANGGAN